MKNLKKLTQNAHEVCWPVLKFLEMSKNKQPIYQKDLCEKFHPGDDSLFCPEFSEEMEAKLEEEVNEVLDRHLPKDYSPFTFDAH